MTKQGDWSESPTQLYARERGAARLLEESFEEGGRTVLESPESLVARAHASVVAPERGAQRARLPAPHSLRQTAPALPDALPRIPGQPTPRPEVSRLANRGTPPPVVPALPRRATPPAPPAVPPSARFAKPGAPPTRDASAERRLTLTPLPIVSPSSVNPASVTPAPLAAPTRQVPLAPRRAQRPATASQYRFIGMVALTGLGLGMGLVFLVRAVF